MLLSPLGLRSQIRHPSRIAIKIMTRKCTMEVSPPVNRWMKDTLVKDAFRKSIPVLAVRVPPAKTTTLREAMTRTNALIDLPRVQSVVKPSDPKGDRLVLLKVSNEAELTPKAREYLETESVELTTYTLELDYDYWLADDILHAILPEELCKDSPSAFSTTGHLAHMNLNDAFLPYKHIIGQVILDKNKHLRTVVNKLNTIDTQFRFFKMELIAGEPNYVVKHHEAGCCFTFDFSQVYWNSRLNTEHERLVRLFKPEDVVADIFAGVGPFAIPAAKKGCAVFANDLNPISAKYLTENVDENLVTDLVKVTCKDGRDFIRDVITQSLSDPFPEYAGPKLSIRERQKEQLELKIARKILSISNFTPAPPDLPPRPRISHFVMNLPDSAITFLDAFRGILLSPEGLERSDISGVYHVMPMIHCYCFTRELEFDKAVVDIRERVEEKLGCPLGGQISFHMVRSVAPNKDMYCISFRLPRKVAFGV